MKSHRVVRVALLHAYLESAVLKLIPLVDIFAEGPVHVYHFAIWAQSCLVQSKVHDVLLGFQIHA